MKKQILALMVSTILCSVNSVIAMEDVNLESTGIPVRFIKNPNNKTLEVRTDDNADANYQAISEPFPVIPGQRIKVDYNVKIAQGIMSFSLLNTNCNGWYQPEVVLTAGNHRGSFIRVVPEGETAATVVLRNYHLEVPGQTFFTLNKLQMEMEAVDSIEMQDVELKSTGLPVSFIKNPDNTLEVTTDDNADANYQARSNRFRVISGQTIKVDYDVKIPQGIMSFGWLNTNCNGWYEPEVVLEAGNYQGSFKRVVPPGETATILVLRNYHLGVPGQTTFKLNKLQMGIESIPHRFMSGIDFLTRDLWGYLGSFLKGKEPCILAQSNKQNNLIMRNTYGSIVNSTDNDDAFISENAVNFKAIKKYSVSGPHLVDLRFKPFINLQFLSLKSCLNITNAVFDFLPSLCGLDIEGCPQITDIALHGLTNLRNLSVAGDQITDAGIQHLVNLEALSLHKDCKVTGSAYKDLSKLRSLSLDHVDTALYLTDLQALTFLDVKDVDIALTLPYLTNLDALHLSGDTDVREEHLTTLSKLKSFSCHTLSNLFLMNFSGHCLQVVPLEDLSIRLYKAELFGEHLPKCTTLRTLRLGGTWQGFQDLRPYVYCDLRITNIFKSPVFRTLTIMLPQGLVSGNQTFFQEMVNVQEVVLCSLDTRMQIASLKATTGETINSQEFNNFMDNVLAKKP